MDRICIGPFEVYPGERLLVADGRPVEIGARALDLLLVLAENPGRLVSKAVLIERVWPRLVVDENNLPAQVASLRRVLGAAAIRTVPRYGYRLDLPVSRAEIGPAGPGYAAGGGSAEPAERESAGGPRSLVGREADLSALRAALGRERLVTLVGAAGVGKSRLAREILALESGRSAANGAFVLLEPLDTLGRVPAAIALAFGLSMSGEDPPFRELARALDGLDVMLVLDGAEHLAASLAGSLAELMDGARGVRVLVTSQVPLGRAGETTYRLGPLPVDEATSLFTQRAMQADQRYAPSPANAALVEEICQRLDGNPLAIELAAARVPAFGLAALHRHLDDRLRLLRPAGSAAGGRHGVLEEAFDWSYGLLTPVEQGVFDGLGAFAAGFTLETAARAVANATLDVPGAIDLVGRLADRSLIATLPREPVRYQMLETARCYARKRLDTTGRAPFAQSRMAAALLDLLDQAYQDYWSLDEAVWLSQYEPELDNVRAALEWARRHDPGLAVALYGSAWPLFVETDQHAEARAAHGEALGLLSDALPPARTARFWEAVATYDSERQFDRARYAAELAASLHARVGERRGQYYALLQLALNGRDDLETAGMTLAEARRLEQSAWPARLLAHGAIVHGRLAAGGARHDDARAAFRRALDLALAASERQALAATVLVVELDIASGAVRDALQLARPLALSLRHAGRRETRHELLALLFGALLLSGQVEEARATGVELYELARRLDQGRRHESLDAMALLAAHSGRPALAARIALAAESARASRGHTGRRPAAARVHAEVARLLEVAIGPEWRTAADPAEHPLDEDDACLRALGLRAEA